MFILSLLNLSACSFMFDIWLNQIEVIIIFVNMSDEGASFITHLQSGFKR